MMSATTSVSGLVIDSITLNLTAIEALLRTSHLLPGGGRVLSVGGGGCGNIVGD